MEITVRTEGPKPDEIRALARALNREFEIVSESYRVDNTVVFKVELPKEK